MAVTPAAHAQSFDADVTPLVAALAPRVPGFRARLEAAGLTADELTDVAALDRLPILTKDELLEQQRAHPPFGGLLATDVTPRRIFQSPGPLYEPETGGDDPWRWRSALTAAGIGPGDRVLIAFGYHLSPAGAMFEAACLALGATVVPGGVGNKDLQVTACVDLGVTAFVGPPSYLKALLEAADDAGADLPLTTAVVLAEPLPPSLRTLLTERVAVVRQAYGTAECGNLGFECDAVEGFHVPDDALVQVCDLTTGAALHDGTQGEVVVTLFGTAYPVVRFGTGDLSSWLLAPCPCGRPTPRIAGWQGRVGDAVKVKGMFLHPRQVETVLARVPDVARYRIVIDRHEHRDIVRCEVVAADGGDGVADRVRAAIRDGLRFNAEVTVVPSLPPGTPTFEDIRVWD